MRIIILGAAFLTLSACGKSEAEVLTDYYNKVVEPTGTPAQQCEEGRKVAAAWAREGDEHNYKVWKLSNDITCGYAQTLAATR